MGIFALIEKHRGGRDGGNTLLTEEGRNLVESYKALRVEFDSSVKVFVKNFFHRINEQ